MTAPQESNVNNALALIDRLEALVVNSVHIPMTTKVLVDEEDLFELLDYLREYLPQEIQEAQNIIKNQATILQEARDTAEKMVSKTKERTREFLRDMRWSSRHKKWLPKPEKQCKPKPKNNAMRQINTLNRYWQILSKRSIAH